MNGTNKTPANRRRNNNYMLMSTRLIRFIRQSYQMYSRLTSTCYASAAHDNTLNNVVLFSFVAIMFRAHSSFLHIAARIPLESHAILFCHRIEFNCDFRREEVRTGAELFVCVIFALRISSTHRIVPIGIIDSGQINSAHLCGKRNYIPTVY